MSLIGHMLISSPFLLFRTLDISDWLALIFACAISLCTSRSLIRNKIFSKSDTAAKTAMPGFPSLQVLSVFRKSFASPLHFKCFSHPVAALLSEESGNYKKHRIHLIFDVYAEVPLTQILSLEMIYL